MSKNINQFLIDERIKLSYLRNRGNSTLVAEELDLDLQYVKKRVARIRKQEKRDVAVLISHNLTQNILLGYESRMQYYLEALKSIDEENSRLVSVCHRLPVIKVSENGVTKYICPKCQKKCKTIKSSKINAMDLKLRILEHMRIEDEQLLNVAQKMGYINADTPPNVVNQIYVNNKGNKNDEVEMDDEIKKLISGIDPADREVLIKNIETKILTENIIDVEVSDAQTRES